MRQEAPRGLHYLIFYGEEMPRGEFKAMLGMCDRGVNDALGALVKPDLRMSDSPQRKAPWFAEACDALMVPQGGEVKTEGDAILTSVH